MPELRISTDKVCDFIEAAREMGGHFPPTTGDDTTTGDDSPLESVEVDEEDDPTRAELVHFLSGLNAEEQVDLLALIYVGRGDFDADQWDDAVAEAGDRIDAGQPDFMLGNPLLAGFLEEGMSGLGKSCDE